jgi:predicted nucleic acid-binding protein
MKYVIDSSVAAKWAVPEIDSDRAIRLRDAFVASLHELSAPEVFHIELAHALVRAERQNRIAIGEAEDLWNEVMTTPPRLFPSLPLMPRAIAIASTERVGVYDCIYVALAEIENCEFVTADDKLFTKLKAKFPFIIPLSAFP